MSSIINQKTTKSIFEISGTGLHTGRRAIIRFIAAPANYGIRFKRTDLAGKPIIAALAENVIDTARGTTIGIDGVSVSTIEHLLAAVSASGIDNLLIEIDSEEVPILDGSAVEFFRVLQSAGLKDLGVPRNFYTIKREVSYIDADRGVRISGSPHANDYRFACEIDYNSSVLGNQCTPFYNLKAFEKEIASARTFVFLHEMQTLLRRNLIRGGSLENAIVIVDKSIGAAELAELATYFDQKNVTVAPQGILNNTRLRYPDEMARHKLLDMIGDLSLVGFPLLGQITGLRPGHEANVAFASKLRKQILSERAEKLLVVNTIDIP